VDPALSAPNALERVMEVGRAEGFPWWAKIVAKAQVSDVSLFVFIFCFSYS
jgi:hypothetical protein